MVLLVSSAALWWAKREPDPLRLGDQGTVTAVAQEDCQSVSINLGEANLSGRHPIPVAWRGQTIQGQLTLDERTGDHSVAGTFTGEDGRTVEVGGGLEGKVFFTLMCHAWPEE